jgi:hypothetical protein
MDVQRLLRALGRGVVAAVVGGLVGAALTRGLMRAVILVADGDPRFSGRAWCSSRCSTSSSWLLVRSPWPGAAPAGRWSSSSPGAVAIPVQAAGIATTDLEAVGPFSAGQWAALVALFVAMAAVYALQAVIAYRLARSGVHRPIPSLVPTGA